jgi:hypothetical protein
MEINWCNTLQTCVVGNSFFQDIIKVYIISIVPMTAIIVVIVTTRIPSAGLIILILCDPLAILQYSNPQSVWFQHIGMTPIDILQDNGIPAAELGAAELGAIPAAELGARELGPPSGCAVSCPAFLCPTDPSDTHATSVLNGVPV